MPPSDLKDHLKKPEHYKTIYFTALSEGDSKKDGESVEGEDGNLEAVKAVGSEYIEELKDDDGKLVNISFCFKLVKKIITFFYLFRSVSIVSYVSANSMIRMQRKCT